MEKISLDELNDAIIECRNKMEGADFIEYHFIKYASEELTKKADLKKKPMYIKSYSHEQAMSIILDFFKSLGVKEWHDQARKIILSQDKNIGISIFNYPSVQHSSVTDENGIRLYSCGSCLESRLDSSEKGILKKPTPTSLIRISKGNRYIYYSAYQQISEKDTISLEDINSIVHEIAHTFDLSNSRENMDKRNMIAEITPFCVEQLLRNYFIENNIADKSIIDCVYTNRTQDIMHHSRYVFTAVNLMKMQKDDGEITKNAIDKFLKDRGVTNIDYVRECFMDVIDSDHDVDYHAKYMIAGLTAIRFMEMYKKDKNNALEALKTYCQNLKQGNVNEKTIEEIGFPSDDRKTREAVQMITGFSIGER